MREVLPGLHRVARCHRLFLATTPREFSFADVNVEFHVLKTKGQLSALATWQTRRWQSPATRASMMPS